MRHLNSNNHTSKKHTLGTDQFTMSVYKIRHIFPRVPIARVYNSTVPKAYSSFASARPAPPRLPKEEQEEYEKLQKQSTGAFQTSHLAAEGTVEPEQLHKDLRRGSKPEFEGDKNPKTGEVGGPKNEPLRHKEWTYNGRATDF